MSHGIWHNTVLAHPEPQQLKGRMTPRWLYVLASCCSVVLAADEPCAASDAALVAAQYTLCASLVAGTTPWCPSPANQPAQHDWPNQAVYLQAILELLASPATCLNTSTAAAAVAALDTSQADAALSGSFMETWVVFQVQYYDMPRQPGVRIEAPDTLGRKCWAFAYLRQLWGSVVVALDSALARAGLDASAYQAAAEAAMPLTLSLCDRVMANCFANATYDPARNGTCPVLILEFAAGFERENALRGFVVAYPFPSYA